MTPRERDHFVGLLHVACRRLRHAIEVLDVDVPESESSANDLLECQRIVGDLVEALCPKS